MTQGSQDAARTCAVVPAPPAHASNPRGAAWTTRGRLAWHRDCPAGVVTAVQRLDCGSAGPPDVPLERVTRFRTMPEVFADSRSGSGILGASPAREVRGDCGRVLTPLPVGRLEARTGCGVCLVSVWRGPRRRSRGFLAWMGRRGRSREFERPVPRSWTAIRMPGWWRCWRPAARGARRAVR